MFTEIDSYKKDFGDSKFFNLTAIVYRMKLSYIKKLVMQRSKCLH